MIAVVEHRRQVGGDALHPPRADRLDPRLLGGVEQRARSRIVRRVAAVDGVAVTGEAQRHRIADAAQDRRLARVGLARRLGQPRARALRSADQGRLVGGEGDLEVRPARHRAGAGGKRALERLGGRIGLAGRLAVGRFDVDGRHEGLGSGVGRGLGERPL